VRTEKVRDQRLAEAHFQIDVLRDACSDALERLSQLDLAETIEVEKLLGGALEDTEPTQTGEVPGA
jgi:hypothetical protein